MATAPFPSFYSPPYAYPSAAAYPPPLSGAFPVPAYGPYSFPSTTTYPPPPYPGGYYTSPFPYAASYSYPPSAAACTPAAGFSPAPAYGPPTAISSPTTIGPFPYESPCLTSEPIPIHTKAEPNWPPPAPDPTTSTPSCCWPSSTTTPVPPPHPATARRAAPPSWSADLAQQLKLAHRSLLNINRRLDEYAESQRSVASLQGKLYKLADRLATPRVSSSASSTTTVPTQSVEFAPSPGSKAVAASALSKFCAEASSSASSVSSCFGASSSAYAAPQVFDKMLTPSSGFENCSAHPNQILSSCVQGGSTNLREQNIDGLPQTYGLHNLIRRTVVRADGTEHSYYALPGDSPLERATPEPLFSKESVGVFASKPGQQPHEKEQQEGDRLLTCSSKALEIDSSGACLNIISDVHDLPLQLQQQDDVKACNVPVLKTSDSVVTSSSKLSSALVLRGLRWLWDPGATEFPFLFMTTAGASKLQCPDVCKLAIVQKLDVKFVAKRVPIFQSDIMRSDAFGLGWTEVNAAVVLALLVPGSNATKVQVPELPRPLKFSLVVILPNEGEFRDKQLAYMCQGTSINLWVKHMLSSCCLPSFEMAKLQWDPGIGTTSSIYLRQQGLGARIATRKPLPWLQILELVTWRSQVTSAPYVWDPGDTTFHVLSTSAGATRLQCTDIYKFEMVQLVHCSAIHAYDLVPALLPSTQFAAKGSNKTEPYELTSRCMSFRQQDVKKSYNAKNLLSSPNYLQILTLDILFITFLPP